MDSIAIYNTLFYVFLGITALGLVLSIFFFFYFDIPTTRAMLTGKAKQNTIRRMEEKNAKTGELKYQYPSTTADMAPRGRTGRTGQTGVQAQTGYTGNMQPVRSNPAAAQQAVFETAVLQSAAPETEVLQNVAPETEVLQSIAPETEVLQSAAPGNAIPGSAAYQTYSQQNIELGQTAMLHPEPTNFPFEVTQTVVVIHTDEII